MAKLDDRVRDFIVRALACFDSPAQVAAAVSEEFAITIDRSQVQKYDPTKAAGVDLSPKWRAIFEQTRKTFVEDASKIPIASKAYRLRRLQRMHEDAISKRNLPLAAALLEQAAKEEGGAFTNRRELTGPNGRPIAVDSKSTHALSDDALAMIAAAGLPSENPALPGGPAGDRQSKRPRSGQAKGAP